MQTIIDGGRHDWDVHTKTIFCEFYIKNSSSGDSLLLDYCKQHIKRHKRSFEQELDYEELKPRKLVIEKSIFRNILLIGIKCYTYRKLFPSFPEYVLQNRQQQSILVKLSQTTTVSPSMTSSMFDSEYEEYADRTMKYAYESLDDDDILSSSTSNIATLAGKRKSTIKTNGTKTRIFPRKVAKLTDPDDTMTLPTEVDAALESGEHDRSNFLQRRKERRMHRIRQKLPKASTFWWTTSQTFASTPATVPTMRLPGIGSFVISDPVAEAEAAYRRGEKIDTIRISPNAVTPVQKKSVTAGIETQQKPHRQVLHSKTGRLYDNDDVDLPPSDYYSKNKEFQSEEDKPKMEAELSLPDLDKWSENSWKSFFIANKGSELLYPKAITIILNLLTFIFCILL